MDGSLILVGTQMGSLPHPHFLNPFTLLWQRTYMKVLAKGNSPYQLAARQLAPDASWEGWNQVATDLGIHAGGASAKLVFDFVQLMETMNEQVASGSRVSDQDRRQRERILTRLEAAYAVRPQNRPFYLSGPSK